MTRLLGIDPGLNKTGWGVINFDKGTLSFVAAGTIAPPSSLPLSERLAILNRELTKIINEYRPDQTAIEETFVNKSGSSTLKLGQARGALLLTLALADLPVNEYSATLVKKSVTGSGHAGKDQIGRMVATLLPPARDQGPDALDALAVAICDSQHKALHRALAKAPA